MMDTGRLLYELRQNKKTILTAAAALIMIAAASFLFLKGNDQTITVEEKEAAASETKVEKSESWVYVDVGGCVRSPGVYRLKGSSRVFEAIEKAGGTTGKADTTGINQAVRVTDGQKITVPEKGASAAAGAASGSAGSGAVADTGTDGLSSAGLININTADSEKLQEIPGVGPVTAESIIKYREENGAFKTKEDIKNVSGIGDKTYEKMEPVITC